MKSISSFSSHSGTPAARMKKVPSAIVKNRSRELTSVFEAFTPYVGMEGRVERIWITEIAADGLHLVGHTKGYIQVLVIGPETMLGTSVMVEITSVGRWSVFGDVIKTISTKHDRTTTLKDMPTLDKVFPCSNTQETCACSMEPEPCACGPESCKGLDTVDENDSSRTITLLEESNSKNLIEWLLRKRKSHVPKRVERDIPMESEKKQQVLPRGSMGEWSLVDRILLGGMLMSIFTIVAILVHLGSRILSSSW